jgi:hypothetical protein
MPMKREDGEVTITLTDEQFDRLLLVLGFAIGKSGPDSPISASLILGLVNAINEGNPNWTPYEVRDEA